MTDVQSEGNAPPNPPVAWGFRAALWTWWEMLPGETWKLSIEALLAHKFRTLLSTVGVLIGSASLMLVVTAGISGGQYVLAQIEGVGSNLVYAERARGSSLPAALSDELTLADMEAVRTAVPDVVEVAGSRNVPMSVTAGGRRSVTVIGITEGFQTIRHLVIVRGRYFDPDELPSGAKVALLTEQVASAMFPDRDPIGAVARVGDLRLTVIGVFRERISTFGVLEVQRESVLVPLRLIQSFIGSEFIKVLYAQAASADAVPEVTGAISRLLASRHRAGARYRVDNLAALLAAAWKISTALTVTFVVVSFIALVVSGVGIMNVMLVTVTERTREIGIRKSVGAPRRVILIQFLTEAGLISGVGAVGGVAVAIWILTLVRALLPSDVALPISPLPIVIALAASASVGLVFGYLPARRAADLEVVDALRHE